MRLHAKVKVCAREIESEIESVALCENECDGIVSVVKG